MLGTDGPCNANPITLTPFTLPGMKNVHFVVTEICICIKTNVICS